MCNIKSEYTVKDLNDYMALVCKFWRSEKFFNKPIFYAIAHKTFSMALREMVGTDNDNIGCFIAFNNELESPDAMICAVWLGPAIKFTNEFLFKRPGYQACVLFFEDIEYICLHDSLTYSTVTIGIMPKKETENRKLRQGTRWHK